MNVPTNLPVHYKTEVREPQIVLF